MIWGGIEVLTRVWGYRSNLISQWVRMEIVMTVTCVVSKNSGSL